MKHRKIEDKDFEAAINDEIDNIADWQLLILKGHILLEYSMNKYIDDCSDPTFDINKTKFSFFNKIIICKAFGLFAGSDHPLLEEAITKFNELRNSIAHNLDYNEPALQKVIELFREMSLRVKPVDASLDDFTTLKQFIPSICGLIIGIKMSKQKLELFKTHILQEQLSKDEVGFKTTLAAFMK